MAVFEYHNAGNTQAQQDEALAYLLAQSTTGKAATGVLSGLGVSQTTTASGSVLVAAGAGVVQAATLDGAGLLVNDSQVTLDVFTANPMSSLPRNDIVVFDRATTSVRVIIGTASSTPADPTVPTSCIPLARLRNAGSATTIPTSAIDDLRTFTTLAFSPTLARAKMVTTADQTLSDSTATNVDFSSASVSYDTAGMADRANSRIKITKAGIYTFTSRVAFALNSTGYRAVVIKRNGTEVIGDAYVAAAPTQPTVVTVTTEPISCAVNDLITVTVVQSAGGTLPLVSFNGRRASLAVTEYVGK